MEFVLPYSVNNARRNLAWPRSSCLALFSHLDTSLWRVNGIDLTTSYRFGMDKPITKHNIS